MDFGRRNTQLLNNVNSKELAVEQVGQGRCDRVDNFAGSGSLNMKARQQLGTGSKSKRSVKVFAV